MLITDPSICRGLQTLCTITAKASLLLGTRCCQGRNLNARHSFNKYLLSADEGPEDPHFIKDRRLSRPGTILPVSLMDEICSFLALLWRTGARMDEPFSTTSPQSHFLKKDF